MEATVAEEEGGYLCNKSFCYKRLSDPVVYHELSGADSRITHKWYLKQSFKI